MDEVERLLEGARVVTRVVDRGTAVLEDQSDVVRELVGFDKVATANGGAVGPDGVLSLLSLDEGDAGSTGDSPL